MDLIPRKSLIRAAIVVAHFSLRSAKDRLFEAGMRPLAPWLWVKAVRLSFLPVLGTVIEAQVASSPEELLSTLTWNYWVSYKHSL